LETIGEADVLRNPERLLEKRGETVPDIDVVGVLETESLGVEERLAELVRDADTELLEESLILPWDTEAAAEREIVGSVDADRDAYGELEELRVLPEDDASGLTVGRSVPDLLPVVVPVCVRVCVTVSKRVRVELAVTGGVGLCATDALTLMRGL